MKDNIEVSLSPGPQGAAAEIYIMFVLYVGQRRRLEQQLEEKWQCSLRHGWLNPPTPTMF